MKAKFEIERG